MNFGVKESPDKVSMGTVEKLTLENMSISFGILSLGGTESEIHLGVIYLPSCSVRFKNTIAALGLIEFITMKLVADCAVTDDIELLLCGLF